MSEIKRTLDETALIKILGVLIDGIRAKDLDTKHASLIEIMKLLDLNPKGSIEFVSLETGGQTYNLEGMDVNKVLDLMKEIEQNLS